MSACSNCGNCQQFVKGESGTCDYCDCTYQDHMPGEPIAKPQTQHLPSQPFEQPPMGGQQFPMPNYGMPQGGMQFSNYPQPMHPGGMQFPNYSQPMPPMPPNYGAGMQGYPGELSQQVGSCVKCRKNNANPGFKWCQSCYDGNNAGMCLKCGKNPPNAGFKWCEPCFQNKKAENPIDCVPEELPQAERCPSCDKKKFYDLKKKKLFDFCGQTCAAQHYKKFGVLRLEQEHEDYVEVDSKFQEKWNINKGACPPITAIIKICPEGAQDKQITYMKALRHGNAELIEYYFHGCKITCDLLKNNSLCDRADCTICLVSKQGFDLTKVGTNVKFTRFGHCLYFAPESSKCHDYTLGVKEYGYRAMFYVKCAPGFKQLQFQDNANRTAPDKGYNSLYGHAGGSLNYDELCLYNDAACVPEYIIIYNKDGVDKRCN